MYPYTHRPLSSSFFQGSPQKELLRGLWVVYTWARKDLRRDYIQAKVFVDEYMDPKASIPELRGLSVAERRGSGLGLRGDRFKDSYRIVNSVDEKG